MNIEEALKLYGELLKGKNALIFISGGSGSGKSYFAKKLAEGIGSKALVIKMDDYYKEVEFKSKAEYMAYNFDSPRAIDLRLMEKQLAELVKGMKIYKPIYAYKGKRKGYEWVESKPIIIVEGLFTFMLRLKAHRIFIDASVGVMLRRRLQRDIKGRDYGKAEVLDRWYNTVLPAYKRWILPMKDKADVVVDNSVAFL